MERAKCDVCRAEFEKGDEVIVVNSWLCCSDKCAWKKLEELHLDEIERRIIGEDES